VPAALAARYDVLEQVGQGGMGVVYRARDRETEETVALKVLKTEIAARPDYIERFKSELRLARKITHKNVCRTHELLRFEETVAIAMEFVEGDSLRAVLKRFGGVPLRRGIEWLRQMCSALGEAHAQGIVHRDLKPENLVVDREGQVRIMDFGIAHSLETDKLEAGVVVGTPAYMSPEQAEGRPLDGRSDIYALGLIAYEMFTGRQAFAGGTVVTQLKRRLQEAPPSPRGVEPWLPPFLERAILKCLERDPERRYASVGELERALAAREDESDDERVPLPAHLSQARPKDAALLLAGVAGLVAFVAGYGYSTPESLVRVRLTRPMLMEKATAELTARGWPPPLAPRIGATSNPGPYEFLARTNGNQPARQALPQQYPHLLLQARFAKAENPRDTAAVVTYEPDGDLRSVELPVIGFVPPGSAGLSRDDALALAQRS
jgi:serine/threonine protein kinase